MTTKVLKWITAALGIVLGLAALATILVTVLIDDEQIKEQLAATVRDQANGATLTIDGDLGLTLWPQIGLRTSGISLVPAGTSSPMLRVAEATAALQIRPLLRQEIQVDGIRINGLELFASVDANGQASWLAVTDSSQPQTANSTDIVAVAASPLAIEVNRLEIDNALIEFDDQQTGQFLRLSEFSLHARNVSISGEEYPLQMQGRVAQSAKAEGDLFQFDGRVAVDIDQQLLSLATVDIRWLPANLPEFQLQSAGSIDLQQAKAEFPSWQLSGKDIEGSGAFSVSWSDLAPQFELPVRITRLNLPALLGATGNELPESIDADALNQVGFSADIKGSTNSLLIDNLSLSAGETELTGAIAYASDGRPTIDANLHFGVLDPGVLLLPAAPAMEPIDDSASTDLPLLLLQLFDARLSVSADQVQRGNYQGTDLVLTASLKDGRLRVEELSANVYDGLIDVRGTLDTAVIEPTLTATTNVIGVDLASVLQAAGSPQNITGALNASASLTASGSNTSAWLGSLTGPADFNVSGAQVHDLNVEQLLCEAIALTNQQSLSAQFESMTSFNALDAKLQFDSGVAHLRPLNASLENLRLNGTGEYLLKDDTFNIVIAGRVTGDLEAVDPACRVTNRMREIDWPMRCQGQINENASDWCGIDRQGVQKIIAQIATDKVKKKVGKELLKGLDKLFGGNNANDNSDAP